ncbi:hypothetical protein Clacol_001932 [Clathrus columnatus]|uniref:Terpene synthase n=1 Tax=Clathrus columnatus TaxID=1419009 RepID=A0AAV4ZZE0_9AGAM|nr:hypothetical protein Clacol_001932 [Clathrus columnatus]
MTQKRAVASVVTCLLFLIDEHTDCVDAGTARTRVDIIMNAIRNPHIPRPQNEEWVGGEVARQFWANAIYRISLPAQTRFINELQAYLDSIVDEASDRESRHIRNIEDYFKIRRGTIGAKPLFAICEMYMNIPEEVIRHPVIKKLSELVVNMIIIGNDLYSYNVEQARGDEIHNLVTIVMHEFKLDIQGAMNWMENFMRISPLNFSKNITIYQHPKGNWMRANESWSFESERYFARIMTISSASNK